LPPYRPLVSNPHLLTILGNFWPRKLDMGPYPVESRLYRTEPDVQVLVQTQRPLGTPRGELILVHGLEGHAALLDIGRDRVDDSVGPGWAGGPAHHLRARPSG